MLKQAVKVVAIAAAPFLLLFAFLYNLGLLRTLGARWPMTALLVGFAELVAVVAVMKSGVIGKAIDACGMTAKGWDEDRLDGD